MNKTLQHLLGLCALVLPTMASAQTAENVEATFTWTIGNEDAATYASDLSDYVSSTSFAQGSGLTASVIAGSTAKGYIGLGDDYNTDIATWQPGKDKPGNDVENMIEFKVKVKKGLTFTPTSIVYNAIKNGTDNCSYSWSYTLDDVESNITDVGKEIIRRNKNNSTVAATHTETITGAAGARTVTFRIYMSGCAKDKKLSFGNIKINGTINGTVEARAFTDFSVNFRTDPYTVIKPESAELPSGVSISGGSYHGAQHGYTGPVTITVSVDGPVKFTIGTCAYGSNASTVAYGDETVTLDTKTNGCDNTGDYYTKNVVWYYNSEEATTLTFTLKGYLPYFLAEACDLLPDYTVTYYNTDGTTVLGTETVQGGSDLKFAYSEADVTVADGYAFRGWFTANTSSALKAVEGTSVQSNLNLYAKATAIEKRTSTARFIYDLTKAYFYDEDHECIDMTGKYYNNHGWVFAKNQTISFPVAGKAVVSISNCQWSSAGEAVVTDASGNQVATFTPKVSTDGAETSFKYDGDATTLTITFGAQAYVHKVSVFNVVDFVTYDETSGYYIIPANDVNSLLLALTEANSTGNKSIFLPDGIYDMGETALTAISGSNISIIGQSMENTIIVNAPDKENEGIGTTATFLITGSNTYFQDLTIKNALDYYGSGSAGRAVCIQDKGTNTVCKNVKMLSYQDTYYSNNNAGSFYWEDSEIHGCVDYICGGGTAFFNRCTLVNESRKSGAKSGEATMTAPNGNTTYGYVFNECTVENLAATFNFGRAWNDKPRCAYINTTLNQPDELIANRWTVKGMNVVADKFVEYNSVNTSDTVVSPTSNKLTFTYTDTKGTTTNEMETILSETEAADYALDKVFTSWAPDEIAAQQSLKDVVKKDGVITWSSDATIFGVFSNGEFVTFTTDKTYTPAATDGTISVRAANGRGGLCPAVEATEASTAISEAEADSELVSTVYYSISGARLAQPQRGVNIVVKAFANGTTKASRVTVK